MRLVDVFLELLPSAIEDTTKSRDGKKEYVRKHLIVENENKPQLTKESLEKFFEEFRERIKKKYGEEIASLYYMKERKYKGKQYMVLGRRHKKLTDKRIKRFISFYFDLEKQRVYIPISYIVRYPRLVNFAILRVLGELGLVRKEYQGQVVEWRNLSQTSC
jgi:hypothetical protein